MFLYKDHNSMVWKKSGSKRRGQEVHKHSLESYEKHIKKMSSGCSNHDNLFGNFLQAYHQNLKKLAQLFKF